MKKIEEELIKTVDEKLSVDDNFKNIENKVSYVPKKNNRKLILRLSYSLASLVIIVVGSIVLLSNSYNKPNTPKYVDDKYKIVNVPISSHDNSSTDPQGYFIPKWDDRTTLEKYFSVEYEDNTYNCWSSLTSTPLDVNYIKEKIGVGSSSGYDIYEDKTYVVSPEIYRIDKVNPTSAVAVKFDFDDNYYAMHNDDYNYEDVKELKEALNLKEYVKLGNVSYGYTASDGKYYSVRFDDVDQEAIYNLLFEDCDESKIKLDSYSSSNQVLFFGISVDAIGRNNLAISVNDDGFVHTNLTAYGRGYQIKVANLTNFIDYLNQNYEGYIVRYVDADNNQNNETSGESIMISDASMKEE